MSTVAVVEPAGRPRPVWRRWLRRVLLAALVVLLLATAWVGWRSWQAYHALHDAQAQAHRLTEGMSGGTVPDASVVSAVAASTATARSATRDPLYRAYEHLPWVGAQLSAVGTVASSLDEVVSVAAPPMLDLVTQAEDGSLRSSDGAFDLAAIAAAAPGLTRADAAAASARDAVAAIHRGGLVGPVGRAVDQVGDALSSLAGVVHSGALAARLGPSMLGADGPRHYLVLALNDAELRPTGGIVGTMIEVDVTAGKISLGAMMASSSLTTPKAPVLPLTAEELAVDGDRLGLWAQNATLTPDFPRTAQLAAARWVAEGHDAPDGVISLDATAVAELLSATGPVTMSDGSTLNRDSFLEEVLARPYLGNPDPVAVDGHFAAVAAAVFSAVAADHDLAAALRPLRTVVAERRLRIWSADAAEQRVLSATSVGGAFLTGPFASDTGLFLTDLTGGKLDYYTDVSVTVDHLTCTGDRPSATLAVRLTYTPPADVASASVYLRGQDFPDLVPGDNALALSVYPAVGDTVGPVLRDGTAVGGEVVTRAGRTGERLSVTMTPGTTTTVQVQVPLHDGRISVWATPTVSSGGAVGTTCGS